MIKTTTTMALERFLAFPQTLVFGFVLLELVSFAFLGFTKILLMIVLTIHLFLPLDL
jgi:hypothetical protein